MVSRRPGTREGLPMMCTQVRCIIAVLAMLWSTAGTASGWNDFTRDIGHGFELSKMNSFQVCIGLKGDGLLVCPSFDSGDFGPVTAYAFTENHLLVRTLGARLSAHIPGHYTSDTDREHFFVIDKRIEAPISYRPTGPLEREAFHAHPAVPGDIHWQPATRFGSDPGAEFGWFEIFLLLSVAMMVYGWPLLLGAIFVILFLVVRRVIRSLQRKGLDGA